MFIYMEKMIDWKNSILFCCKIMSAKSGEI